MRIRPVPTRPVLLHVSAMETGHELLHLWRDAATAWNTVVREELGSEFLQGLGPETQRNEKVARDGCPAVASSGDEQAVVVYEGGCHCARMRSAARTGKSRHLEIAPELQLLHVRHVMDF